MAQKLALKCPKCKNRHKFDIYVCPQCGKWHKAKCLKCGHWLERVHKRK